MKFEYAMPLTLLLLVTACANPAGADIAADKSPASNAGSGGDAIAAVASKQTMPTEAAPRTMAELPKMVVHKSPTCGCCGAWVEHMRGAGFSVEVRESDDLGPIKEALGIPYGKGSCHTAEVDGYFVEGHVPAEDVKRLLAEKPGAKGLVLPGMPAGSPGMEMPDGRTDAYTVELVTKDGDTTAFAHHGEVR